MPQGKQKCTKDGGGWSVLDYLPSFDLPSLPDGLVDFSAGLKDALLFGLGNPARYLLGINGSVDTTAGSYSAGSRTSFGFGAGRLGYAAVAKGYSVVASSGAAASAFRGPMRMPGAPVRYSSIRSFQFNTLTLTLAFFLVVVCGVGAVIFSVLFWYGVSLPLIRRVKREENDPNNGR